MSTAVEILLSLIAGLLLLGMLAGVVFAFRHEARSRRLPVRDPQHDLANMMILFQTMRDIVQQQKELARQFNESLEQRIGAIRHAASAAAENLDRLQEAERRLFQRLEEASAELASVQKQTQYLKESRSSEWTPREESTPASDVSSSNESAQSLDVENNPEPDATDLRIVSPPIPSGEDDDELFAHWVGFDFGVEELDPYVLEMPPDDVPDAPEDPKAARDAFRSLLNLDDTSTVQPSNGPASSAGPHSNGRGVPGPVQARVFEYHDAGMTVSEIAQELGIGKGEIRLMLTLRNDKDE